MNELSTYKTEGSQTLIQKLHVQSLKRTHKKGKELQLLIIFAQHSLKDNSTSNDCAEIYIKM